jgi:hypothetical protein
MARKRIRLLLTVAGCFSSLAIYADTVAVPPASDNIHQSVTTNKTAQTTTEKSTSTIPITAKLNLAQKDQRLYARVVIRQSKNISGKIMVEWTPPAHSNCMKSHYELSYEGKKFHTQSYRTIAFSNKDKTTMCHGSWQVAVKNLNGMQLAQSEFDVKTKGAV